MRFRVQVAKLLVDLQDPTIPLSERRKAAAKHFKEAQKTQVEHPQHSPMSRSHHAPPNLATRRAIQCNLIPHAASHPHSFSEEMNCRHAAPRVLSQTNENEEPTEPSARGSSDAARWMAPPL